LTRDDWCRNRPAAQTRNALHGSSQLAPNNLPFQIVLNCSQVSWAHWLSGSGSSAAELQRPIWAHSRHDNADERMAESVMPVLQSCQSGFHPLRTSPAKVG
jgi:hypothetical protein